MKKLTVFILSFFFASTLLFAQKGKDGTGNITAANTVVNQYTNLKANAAVGAMTITVGTSNFAQAGDLILIIQMQGATIQGGADQYSPVGSQANPSDWGHIINYNTCGNYEFKEVLSCSGTTITLKCGLEKAYTTGLSVTTTHRTQVVHVPRYSSLTVNSGASITAQQWTTAALPTISGTGGVIAIEVGQTNETGNITVNGSIDASGQGFRGGAPKSGTDVAMGCQLWWGRAVAGGGLKGEGIGGYPGQDNGAANNDPKNSDFASLGGWRDRAAPANGGGGGNTHNAGGGGGSNAMDPLNTTYDGLGNPDISNASWIQAWNLEGGNFANHKSSGGGRGGYGWSYSNQNALVIGPDNGAWTGDNRPNVGGHGGRPLDYSTGKIFMGGGGGAGDGDNHHTEAGGNGGGIVIILCYGGISGSGKIIANGAIGGSADHMPGSSPDGADAPSGGGGGGVVILKAANGVSITDTISANGGKGGSQSYVAPTPAAAQWESEGGGGGGGGGYVAVYNGTTTVTSKGGPNGITTTQSMTEFPPNGGTAGASGLAYQFPPQSKSSCAGDIDTLKIADGSKPLMGPSVCWFDSTGANVATGDIFITPPLAKTITYYYGNCASCGDGVQFGYKINVQTCGKMKVFPAVTPNKICVGQSVSLSANAIGGTSPYTYKWNNQVPDGTGPHTVNPTVSTTYQVTVTDASSNQNSGSVSVVVNPLPTVTFGPLPVIPVDTTPITLPAGTPSGGKYFGVGVTSNNFDPSKTGAGSFRIYYSYIDANGCKDSNSAIITVKPRLAVLKVPNVFTPNNDGANDVFKVIHDGDFASFSVIIFNRWGIKVYESKDVNFEWTGKGYSDGVYYYIIEASGADNQKLGLLKGTVTIVR